MVYVDAARWPYKRMRMCHMVADTPEELLAMAARIGVAARHIQKAGTPEEHFDVCQAKRALAIRGGALECERATLVRVLVEKRRAANLVLPAK